MLPNRLSHSRQTLLQNPTPPLRGVFSFVVQSKKVRQSFRWHHYLTHALIMPNMAKITNGPMYLINLITPMLISIFF